MGANLYKLLGKKTRIESSDKTKDKTDLSGQHNEKFDVILDSEENNIEELERNFNKESFLEGAKKLLKLLLNHIRIIIFSQWKAF